ncbi:type II secretion system protein GspG [Pseudomonas sp. CGJS7]|uniref:type II secretion system protein GspG n=1 Tax=Pseudomonas sp. CGJS7 TaxID=3109348 RepID=UPI003009B830
MKLKIVAAVLAALVLAVSMHVAWRVLMPDPYHHSAHQRTSFDLRYLAHKIEIYRQDTGCPPRRLEALTLPIPADLGPYAKPEELRDGWGRSYYYRRREDCKGFLLFSLGKDGQTGGDDQDADITYEGGRAQDIRY